MNTKGYKILLVEDEQGLILTLSDRLENEGYIVETANNGLTGYEMASTKDYALILLDLMLPQKNGLDICRDLRSHGVNTPIIMLTAKGQVYDKVLGFKLGADDYVTKPFEMAELLSRIEALLRRSQHNPNYSPDIFQFGTVYIDFKKAVVKKENKNIQMSMKEFMLLKYLIENRDQVLSREKLLNAVWGYESTVESRTVDVHIAWLRQKIEDNASIPHYILTIHGMGYKFTG